MSDSTTEQYIWEHKFRPKTLKDVILPQDYRNFFNKIVQDNAGVNILLESRHGGTGKTTVAQALANDLGAQFMKLNASNSNVILHKYQLPDSPYGFCQKRPRKPNYMLLHIL